jgi:hypothetical protein
MFPKAQGPKEGIRLFHACLCLGYFLPRQLWGDTLDTLDTCWELEETPVDQCISYKTFQELESMLEKRQGTSHGIRTVSIRIIITLIHPHPVRAGSTWLMAWKKTLRQSVELFIGFCSHPDEISPNKEIRPLRCSLKALTITLSHAS